MAVTYGFFNSVNGDRKYNADTMSEFYTGICSQGVFQSVDNGLAVSAGTGLTVNVATGRAIIQGHWVKNDAALTLSIDAASATYARIDAVVIRYSASNRNIQIVVKTGTPAASPSAPSMTRAGGVYELCLAYVNVAANATSVTVTDKRSNTSVCGWAAVAQSIDGTYEAMIDDIKTGFDGVVYQSPGDAVRECDRILNGEIDTLISQVNMPDFDNWTLDSLYKWCESSANYKYRTDASGVFEYTLPYPALLLVNAIKVVAVRDPIDNSIVGYTKYTGTVQVQVNEGETTEKTILMVETN